MHIHVDTKSLFVFALYFELVSFSLSFFKTCSWSSLFQIFLWEWLYWCPERLLIWGRMPPWNPFLRTGFSTAVKYMNWIVENERSLTALKFYIFLFLGPAKALQNVKDTLRVTLHHQKSLLFWFKACPAPVWVTWGQFPLQFILMVWAGIVCKDFVF